MYIKPFYNLETRYILETHDNVRVYIFTKVISSETTTHPSLFSVRLQSFMRTLNNPSKYMCGSKCFLIFGYYIMTKTIHMVSSTPLHKRESYLQTLVLMGVSELSLTPSTWIFFQLFNSEKLYFNDHVHFVLSHYA